MGMGYGANYADIVSQEFVEETAPMEFANFLQALENVEANLDSFAQDTQNDGMFGEDEETDYGDEVDQAFDALVNKFQEVTGLSLTLNYHNRDDEGDRYDDVDGIYWEVGGVYELSEAGKRYQDEITRCTFVVFG